MQLVYYTLAGVLLYFLSDWILVRVEAWRGAAFEQRSLIFFVVILVLALTSFKAIELWLGG
ncbi:MAG TPA: hypothetical protein VKB27_11640 [Gammaproteobacteria bacterium]|nr:hypothetical protein [Gammaproteobacteria bacterium]